MQTLPRYRGGSKRTGYIYFPLAGRLGIPALSYCQLKDKLDNLGVKAGLYGKFAKQVLGQLAHENSIPLDAVALVMGRGLTVVGAHYLNTRKRADRLFGIYVNWLMRNAYSYFLILPAISLTSFSTCFIESSTSSRAHQPS